MINKNIKFEYWKNDKGQWYWHLKASNGEPIAQGEGYHNKADLLETIKLVKGSFMATTVDLSPSEE